MESDFSEGKNGIFGLLYPKICNLLSDNVFYALMPSGFLGVGIVIATVAAIIASQALISGVFSMIGEAVNLDIWPRMKISYTGNVKGQLYVPAINLFLYAGCIGTVLLFRSSGRMEAAYGLAITITMLATTILLWRYMRNIGTPAWLSYSFFIVFCLLEGAFSPPICSSSCMAAGLRF